MLDIIIGSILVAILLAICTFLILVPYNFNTIIISTEPKGTTKIPGPKGLPYFGNILTFNVPREKLIKTFMDMHREYGDTFCFWVIGFMYVFINDPDDIEVILNNRSHITKSLDYRLLEPWLSTGLLTSTGEKWHTRRKILTPAFHFKILEEYVQVFNVNSEFLVKNLEAHIKEPFTTINEHINKCTLDIICEAAMGIPMHDNKYDHSEYTKAVKRLTKILVHRQLSPWLYRQFIYNLTPIGREDARLLQILHGFTNRMIKERREEYRANLNSEENFNTKKKRRLAFLDLLIEISEKEGLLTDADIREEVDTFMFEGHDTTEAAISWTLYLLGAYPDVQEKVVAELNDIFWDSDRPATYEDLQRMKYLEQVIKETLRLYPSVPGFNRKLDVDVKLKNYTIPAGAFVPISPLILHRNAAVFPNPEEFNPDHFLPEKVQGRHPFAYIPFSAGPRNCIGK
ncbi:cytochrome P450 4C1-like isoform X2 [Zootermopsis nevadensis]|uniref:cytochrome P450 4C1-like isoform X2 n=1 Tax=Zootermopsis nevadensis TaxID=136037 RepID=UPI000B8E271B|nr:cytochrome P450 4C1-like isoform X2 [Zootermopsis nevadensis]